MNFNCLVIIEKQYRASHLFYSLLSLFSEISNLVDYCKVVYSLRGLDFIAEMVLCNPVFLNETKKPTFMCGVCYLVLCFLCLVM